MDHDLEVFPDPAAVAARAADYVAGLARTAVAAGSRFSFAVSGGQTPWAMFRALAAADMPWASAELFQVDERVAPAGDPDRNLTHLRESLGAAAATLHPMPVGEEDLAAAARAYAAALPARFDLVTWASARMATPRPWCQVTQRWMRPAPWSRSPCPTRGTGG